MIEHELKQITDYCNYGYNKNLICLLFLGVRECRVVLVRWKNPACVLKIAEYLNLWNKAQALVYVVFSVRVLLILM